MRSNRGDLRVALAESSKQLTPQSGPRVIQHTVKSNKVIDTEKTLEKKALKADGSIVTEKKRTVEHEEVSRLTSERDRRDTVFAFSIRSSPRFRETLRLRRGISREKGSRGNVKKY